MALTGNFEFRKTFWGKIVLRVEDEVKPFWSRSKPGVLKRRWRDATLMDLAAPEMRYLIDSGLKPWARPQSQPTQSRVFGPQRTEMPAPVEAAPVPIQPTNSEPAPAVH